MHKVTSVRVLDGFRLEVTFEDGTAGVVDLSSLAGKGVFSAWGDRRVFESVRIGSSGELVWGDAIDLCPDALYLKVTGKTVEEVFPSVRREATHA